MLSLSRRARRDHESKARYRTKTFDFIIGFPTAPRMAALRVRAS